jgi:hypothetical protein
MSLSTHRRSRSLTKYVLFGLTVVLAAATLAVVASADNSDVYADGNDSPGECLGNPQQNPNADNVISSVSPADAAAGVEVPAGNVVTGVCIKTGQTPHSGPLGNGTYDGAFTLVDPGSADACYVVEGVGTQEVTVTHVAENEGPDCQDISHIDVIFAPPNGDGPPPNGNGTTTTTTPGQQVTPPPGAPARIVVGAAPFTG